MWLYAIITDWNDGQNDEKYIKITGITLVADICINMYMYHNGAKI